MTEGLDCSGIRYLSFEDIVKLNESVILMFTPDEPIGVLNETMLHSSQQSPGHYHYYEQCEDMSMLAAVLADSIAKNHAFHNANKRTAALAALNFLLMNGHECTGPWEEFAEIIEGLITRIYTREDLSNWFCKWCRPFDARDLELCD
jgi:death on curing protein